MSDKVYKHIELTGTSSSSIEDAVSTAIAKAARTVHNMRWFEIVETRGNIEGGKVKQWQTTIRVGFSLDD
ncbi:MAG: dodecin domain-containing protein [Krumholzibacteria bacterium]|nr:dodecin domain-containing protein [Candidatus Krumholzibacteria bacterium]